MKHLIIGLDNFRGVKPQTLSTLPEYMAYRTGLASQDRLLDTGDAIHLISQALANLPNLVTVDIRDFNSPTRYRDTQDTRARAASARAPEWKSYGHSEYHDLLRRYGSWLIDPYVQGTSDFVDRVFRLVLTALGRSAAPIQSLEVLLRNPRAALRDDAFTLFPALDVGVPTVLHGLKTLHLHLSLDPIPMPDIVRPPVSLNGNQLLPSAILDPATANLRRFLSFTPNVTWLRLNFVGQHGSEVSTTLLLCWLAQKPSDLHRMAVHTSGLWSDANPKPVDLPLKKLDLGNFSTEPETLSGVIMRFNQLEELSLRRIVLECDPSKYGNEEVDHGSPWPRFFRKLRTCTPKLKKLSLHNLATASTLSTGTSEIVRFMDNVAPTLANRVSKDLSGLDKDKAALERLAESTWTDTCHRRVHNPDQVSENSDEEDLDSALLTDDDDEILDESDGVDDEDEDAVDDVDPGDVGTIIDDGDEDDPA